MNKKELIRKWLEKLAHDLDLVDTCDQVDWNGKLADGSTIKVSWSEQTSKEK